MNHKTTLTQTVTVVKKKTFTTMLLFILMFVYNTQAQNTTIQEPGPLALSPGVGEQVLFQMGELTGTLTGVGIIATFTSGSNAFVHANDLSVFVLDGPTTILQVGGYTQLVVGGEKRSWATGNTTAVPTTFSDTQTLDTPISFSLNDNHRVAMAIGNYAPGAAGTWESVTITLNGVTTSSASVNKHQKLKLSVYPNPSKDVLNITCSNTAIIDSVKILDINGKIIRDIKTGGHLTQLNISDLTAGLYMVVVNTDGKEIKEKFIKQ